MNNQETAPISSKLSSLLEVENAFDLNSSKNYFDEFRGHTNNALPVWQEFLEQLDAYDIYDFERKKTALSQQVRENGITYNVYADENGPQRPWSLDLLPLIIDHSTWQEIEEGVLQRTLLLEKIIQDIYGPQELLKSGLIPPALIHAHPGYLRAMHGAQIPGRKHLHIVAFDLARAPNGKWSVISQRTQAPSGLGYLLENRNLIARQFPKAYETMNISPLANVYKELIDSLKMQSTAGADAHIALLTPGPYNETYFEHAYLARYLGLTLVEGGDLTVRNQHVFLKTVKGLEPVHVLLKRLDDEFLDPLELRSDSTLGVPGILEAIRAGNVIVANAPGSAFLESAALLGFLPGISEKLLGEKILLPAMDTWWCGERPALEAAIPNLKHSALKPTYPHSLGHQYFESTLGGHLSDKELDEWIGRITRQPDEYTVQTYIPLAKMPTKFTSSSENDRLSIELRSYMLRIFVLSNGENSWKVLPGGLARIAGDDSGIASMQRGGSSADVWVQNQQEIPPNIAASTNPHLKSTSLRKRIVTSRSAENLYWFGRYTERSENTLRLARLYLESINSNKPSKKLWAWLETMCDQYGLVPEGIPGTSDHTQTHHRIYERTLIASLNELEHVTSVGFNLNALRRTASTVRERLSPEQWMTINRCIENFNSDCLKNKLAQDFSSSSAIDILNRANDALASITGAQTDRMTRDDGWQLLAIGRNIERLGFLTSALSTAFKGALFADTSADDSGFIALLALFDSTITFHAQHQQSREIEPLISLLVLDNENPRSLAWVTKAIRSRLSKLADVERHELDPLAQILPNMKLFNLSDLAKTDLDGEFRKLQDCLSICAQAAWQVSDDISAHYFNLVHANKYKVQA